MQYRLLLIYFALITSVLSSQWRFQSDGPLSMQTVDGETIREYKDNVIIKNDNMTLITDKATQYTKRDEILLEGSVRMLSDTDTLICDRMYYWSKNDSALASGSVQLENKTQKITSDEITYIVTNGPFGFSFISNGNTVIRDSIRTISGNYISYDDRNQRMNIKIDAKVIESDKGISGDAMSILFAEKTLETILVEGKSSAYQNIYTKSKTNIDMKNIMDGESIKAELENNNIRILHIRGMAQTTYHVFDDNSLIGKNNASGDEISLRFIDGNLNEIEVFTGGRGKFLPSPNNGSIDSTIYYRAEYIDHLIDVKKTHLLGDGEIRYKGTLLESESIFLNWENNTLIASEIDKRPSVVYTRENEPLYGKSIEYNMITNRGKLRRGKTKMNDSFFHGENMYKGDEELYHVFKGKYTSCDLDRPHFHLSSKHMKMLHNDKIIARPMILYIQDIPVFGLPFAVIPNRKGERRSGWIMPQIGESGDYGFYLKNLGYYWAPNQYMDYRVLLNFYDRDGGTINTLLRYKKIYKYSGNISTSLTQNLRSSSDIFDILNSYSRLWSLNWLHTQDDNRFGELKINYNYVSSSSYYQDSNISIDPEKRLNQQLTSGISYNKSLFDNISVSASITENYYLLKAQQEVDNVSLSPAYKVHKPRVTFSHSHSQGSTTIQISTRYSGYNNVSNYSSDGVDWTSSENLYRDGISHYIGINTSKNIFGWLNISPNLSIQEEWLTNILIPSQDSDGTFHEMDINQLYGDVATSYLLTVLSGELNNESLFKRRTTLYGSIEANTKLFGVFPINIGKLRALRHTVTPKLSLRYKPEKIFGDYIIEDGTGNDFDAFEYSIFRGASVNSYNIYSISLNNLIESKILIDEGQYKKSQLLSWNLATTYDRDKDSINFSTISSSIQTNLFNLINLSIRTNHDIYKSVLGVSGDDDIQRYKKQNTLSVPQLKYINASTSINIAGQKIMENVDDSSDKIGQNNWDARLSIRYSNIKSLRINDYKEEYYWEPSLWIDNQLKIKLTEQWKLSYRSRIDMLENSLLSQSISISRDLHCWEFDFSWWPGGLDNGFLLSIRVKNPTLQDIKLRSSGGTMLKL